jgi:ATP-dependent DNA ligase
LVASYQIPNLWGDGFRIIARKKGAQVRLYSRPSNDLNHRLPLLVAD